MYLHFLQMYGLKFTSQWSVNPKLHYMRASGEILALFASSLPRRMFLT